MKRLIVPLFGLLMTLSVHAQKPELKPYVDSLMHQDYLLYVESYPSGLFKPISEAKWQEYNKDEYELHKLCPQAPGSYLIKARSQIVGGFILSGLSTTGIVLNAALNYDGDSYNAIYYAMGGLGVVAVILEISGVVNIGKAGVALNNNGVGINIKF